MRDDHGQAFGGCRLDVDALAAAAAELRAEAAAWFDVEVDDDGVRTAPSVLELQASELEAIALAQSAKDFGDETFIEVSALVSLLADGTLSLFDKCRMIGDFRSECDRTSRAVQAAIGRLAAQAEARSGRRVVVLRDEEES
jgi:hypothetical protein